MICAKKLRDTSISVMLLKHGHRGIYAKVQKRGGTNIITNVI